MSGSVITVGLDPVNRRIGARLKALRKSRGLSQEQLAAIIGVTSQQVHKYEAGINRISGAMLYGLAWNLKVPIAAFFEGLPDPVPDHACEPEGAPQDV
jgi:transcriptional regulator with XRE-family HTH domain